MALRPLDFIGWFMLYSIAKKRSSPSLPPDRLRPAEAAPANGGQADDYGLFSEAATKNEGKIIMQNAMWIRADEISAEPKLYAFQKTFSAPKGARLSVRVSADSRYKLRLNGTFLLEGPCHGTRYQRHYETANLSHALREGENTLSVEVLHVTDGVWLSLFRESTAALWLDGCLTLPDGTAQELLSDESWQCLRADHHRFAEFPGFIRSIPPVETLELTEKWVPVGVRVFSGATPQSRCFNEYGVRETYPLVPRPIPNMTPGAPRPMHCLLQTDTACDYDAGRYETAYIHLTLSAKAGTTVRLIAAECKSRTNSDGKTVKGLRDDPMGEISGPYDKFVFTEDGTLHFDSFYWRAFRYLRLEGDRPFSVEALTFSPYYYPMGDEGRVTCPDERYNRMWDISRHTVMCCAHDNYVDCPFYEQQQYDMDSGLQMLFTLRMTADTALPRKSLSDLAYSQLPDGMLQANYPSVVVQVIPSFSLFWILMLRDYCLYTGDLPFVRQLFGTAEKILSAFDNLLTAEGLVGPSVYWPFVDWAPEWGITGVPDGGTKEPLTVNTLLYAYTLRAAAHLCTALGRDGQAADYLRRADRANAAANKHCYDPARGLYRNTPTRAAYSQHTAVWGVLSGAVTGEEARQMMRRVMTEPVSRCTFSMNYYLFRALEQTGLYDEYAEGVFAGWQTMMDLHCTTWCENPDNPRSECHGWSAAPIYEMSAVLLGVCPTEDGFAALRIAPRLHRFASMEGTVPTPYGLISVDWHREGEKTVLRVTLPAPEKMACTVCLPDKDVLQTTSTCTYEV